jgi:MFS family permease
MAWVTNWWQLVICRALLGMLEAGFFPACMLLPLEFCPAYTDLIPGTYIIGSWYVRGEIQKRMTGFYILTIMVSCGLSPFTVPY